MKLLKIQIQGVRGIANEAFVLDPVTLIIGPNGSGKSTLLGCVLFALTGWFPGLPGMNAGGKELMERVKGDGFEVVLEAQHPQGQVVITRSCKRGKMVVSCVAPFPHLPNDTSVKANEARITMLFGDASFLLDTLGDEGSIWGMSAEARKKWASALCRSASGWTHEKLEKSVGPKTDDWNPRALEDPAASLDLNLAKITEAVRDAQAVARNADTVANTVTAPMIAPTPQEIAYAQDAYQALRDEYADVDRRIKRIADERVSYDRDVATRARLQADIQEAKNKLSTWQVPGAPLGDGTLGDQIDQADMEVLTLDMDVADARTHETEAVATHKSLVSRLHHVSSALQQPHGDPICPTCGHASDVRTFEKLHQEFVEMILKAERTALSCRSSREKLETKRKYAQATLAKLRALVLEQDRATELHSVAVERNAEEREWVDRTLRGWQDTFKNMPEPSAPSSDVTLRERGAELREKGEKARSDLNDLTTKTSLARERENQTKAADEARVRIETLKLLLQKVVEARDKMLTESIAPFQTALAGLSSMAPAGCSWGVSLDKNSDTLAFGMVNHAHDFVPAETLSTGERYRLTAAILIARAQIRREPWVGVVLDGFECVYPEAERAKTLASLRAAVDAGHADTIIVAGAVSGVAGVTAIGMGCIPAYKFTGSEEGAARA